MKTCLQQDVLFCSLCGKVVFVVCFLVLNSDTLMKLSSGGCFGNGSAASRHTEQEKRRIWVVLSWSSAFFLHYSSICCGAPHWVDNIYISRFHFANKIVLLWQRSYAWQVKGSSCRPTTLRAFAKLPNVNNNVQRFYSKYEPDTTTDTMCWSDHNFSSSQLPGHLPRILPKGKCQIKHFTNLKFVTFLLSM